MCEIFIIFSRSVLNRIYLKSTTTVITYPDTADSRSAEFMHNIVKNSYGHCSKY